MSNASSARRGRYRQAARDAAFLLRLWPILLPAFLVVVPLIALGAGTAVLGVGVPVLVLGLSVSSRFAEIGRRAVADVDSSDYVPGHYRRAEADARSRLERDIHDGPQQRLVRLGMDLARAKRQTSRNPRAAETILDGAIAQTRETLDELRSLSRGSAPPVLVDRGLAAALAEAAARGELVLEPDVVAQVMRRGRRNDPIKTLTPRERDPRRLPVSRVLPPGLAPRGIDLLFFHGVQRRLRAGARSEAGCPSGQWELTVNQPL